MQVVERWKIPVCGSQGQARALGNGGHGGRCGILLEQFAHRFDKRLLVADRVLAKRALAGTRYGRGHGISSLSLRRGYLFDRDYGRSSLNAGNGSPLGSRTGEPHRTLL
jgi:hypothetical protein